MAQGHIPNYMQNHPNTFEPIRSFSPAPLIEFLPEIDFVTPVFIGDSATQILPIHASLHRGLHNSPHNSWFTISIGFRTIQIDSNSILDQISPFVIRQSDFHLVPGRYTIFIDKIIFLMEIIFFSSIRELVNIYFPTTVKCI
jgi:hypothetical protein